MKTLHIWICFAWGLSFSAQVFGQYYSGYMMDAGDMCPRKPDMANRRKCLKKCRSDSDCRGRNKRCLCDDVCGKSCVKPTMRCKGLNRIENGYYEIIPFNHFGAKVHYKCDGGYVMLGQDSRLCQGDGRWSGVEPSCESDGKCREPPFVAHAFHDASRGTKYFPLGTQIQYMCRSGYYRDGFFKAMCVGEGRWAGPRMTCSPKSCGHPGDISHGRREGHLYYYPNRVRYICDEGYEMVGRAIRICQASGQWSGEQPMCRAVRCSSLGAPQSGHMFGFEFTYDAVVRFSCYRGFHLQGSPKRRCQANGKWSGENAKCSVIDCGLPSPFWNGYLDGQQSTFGSIIIFRCFGRTKFDGESTSTECLESGKWSYPLPKCWGTCEVPELPNGSPRGGISIGDRVDHGNGTDYKCLEGYRLNTEEIPMCNNGTWTFIPECKPAPCEKRPPNINDGYVRYHWTNHGDIAKYLCHTGFKLIGESYLTCEYGVWGKKQRIPFCEPLYCPFPGVITDGKVLLVGMIGKYEYRHYVRRIGQNEQIEFQCNKGFKRNGTAAATCVAGRWSPDSCPTCIPEKHPTLPFRYRWKRDTQRANKKYCPWPGTRRRRDISTPTEEGCEDIPRREYLFREVLFVGPGALTNSSLLPPGSQIEVKCGHNYQLTTPTRIATCQGGQWAPFQPGCKPKSCSLVPIKGTKYHYVGSGKALEDEYQVPHGEVMETYCEEGYELASNTSVTSGCLFGKWTQILPTCTPSGCDSPAADHWMSLKVVSRGTGPQEYAHRTTVQASCQDHENPKVGTMETFQCILGNWQPGPPSCVRAPQIDYKVLGVHANNNGTLVVYPESTVILTCKYYVAHGKPRWSSDNGREYEQQYARSSTDYLLYLSLAKEKDSGTYTCYYPHVEGPASSLKVKVKALHCEELAAPENGSLQAYDSRITGAAVFNCVSGFQLKGPQGIHCLQSGQWSAAPPTCVKG